MDQPPRPIGEGLSPGPHDPWTDLRRAPRESEPGTAPRHPSVHFLWAVPAAILASLPVYFIAWFLAYAFYFAGGSPSGPDAVSVGLVLTGSLIVAGPLGFVPWTKDWRVRVIAMTAFSLWVALAVWETFFG